MKYKHRAERKNRDEMKFSKKYESRKSLRGKYDLTRFVNKIRRKVNTGSTFQGYGDSESIVDKYYIDSHFPPRDVLTELGQLETEKKTKTSLATIGLIILGLVLLRKKV